MKIAVTVVIEVNPEEWVDIYGTDRADVRQDVKEYVLNDIQQSAGMQDTGATVTLR